MFSSVAAGHGLSPPQARLLLRLFEPTAMRDLAAHLACDASNVTGIAARVVERGLITTTPGVDRRVRLQTLTAAGRRLRAALDAHITDRSPAMTRLTVSERRILVGLLDKLMATNPLPEPSARRA